MTRLTAAIGEASSVTADVFWVQRALACAQAFVCGWVLSKRKIEYALVMRPLLSPTAPETKLTSFFYGRHF